MNIKYLCILLFLIGITSSSNAEQLVVTEILPPYQFYQENNVLNGFSVEVMDEIFKITDDDIDLRVLPWARAYKTAINQANTLIFSLSRTLLREDSFIWGGKLMTEDVYAWGLKEKFQTPITNIKQLRKYKIAVTNSSSTAQHFQQQQYPYLHVLGSPEQSLQMLYINRVDIITGTKNTLTARASELNLDITKLKKMISLSAVNHDLYFAFSLNSDEEIVTKYMDAYKTIKNNGILDKLKNKWQVK
ncbi:substrate-binding periplasmic protein [Colwellia hornerae]|uniref:Amino acid ABC transporter substrate-binding protein n=1 Tax=Colwellia hornerae TaxID=89402 RepID=A0A5C6Q2Q0_9GAMM|nr:transporter substrate-binding domain-containing protein [Colwellia hornerae]TWX46564.1 amino acid ABC transporter substrate-binding protein [Colwellia hornerae]TWX54312.1 amino acid ABC transporter substrate-binding protein [Colwellia hornerae]TWX63114.1 amino acid ABC transporter substrate-binding protein [Colwellia hornerae]